MKQLTTLALLALILASAPAAQAQDDQDMIVVTNEQPGRTVLFVLDPVSTRLLVYEYVPGGRLTLQAVRNIEYELLFEQFPGRQQRPSVKEVHDTVLEARPRAPHGLAGLVELELELIELRQRLETARATGAEEPTVQGVPLSRHLRALERDALKLRLDLVEADSLEGVRAALSHELEARIARVRDGLRTCEDLGASLPADHGGRPHLNQRTKALREQLERLERLQQAERPPEPAPPKSD